MNAALVSQFGFEFLGFNYEFTNFRSDPINGYTHQNTLIHKEGTSVQTAACDFNWLRINFTNPLFLHS